MEITKAKPGVEVERLPEPHVLGGHYRDHTDLVDGYSEQQVRQIVAAERAEAVRMRGILQGVVELARDAHAHWDGDRDAKVGKLLLALAGHAPRYDPRADALHAALSPSQQGEQL